jgi:hypothetical protein
MRRSGLGYVEKVGMTTKNQIDKMKKVAVLSSGVDHLRKHLEGSVGRCSLWVELDNEGKLMFLMAAVSLFILQELEDVSYEEGVAQYKRELRRQVRTLDQAEAMVNDDPSQQWDRRR